MSYTVLKVVLMFMVLMFFTGIFILAFGPKLLKGKKSPKKAVGIVLIVVSVCILILPTYTKLSTTEKTTTFVLGTYDAKDFKIIERANRVSMWSGHMNDPFSNCWWLKDTVVYDGCEIDADGHIENASYVRVTIRKSALAITYFLWFTFYEELDEPSIVRITLTPLP